MNRSPLRRVLVFAMAIAVMAPAAPAPARGRPPLPPAPPVAQAPAGVPAARARPGELLVKARRGGYGLDAAVQRAGGQAVAALGGGVSLVRVPVGREGATAERLAADPSVAHAEPNYVVTASSHAGEADWAVSSTGAPRLWDRPVPITGSGVRVAVVDSGVDASHPQLRDQLSGKRFDAFGGNGSDDCGHGTAVAGVVAAEHDGAETVGVAPTATIVPVRVLRFDGFYGTCGGSSDTLIEGIRWAADPRKGDADIINLSLGGSDASKFVRDAVAYAVSQGVLVVAASGNTGDRTVQYPAAYPGVLSVGGLRRSGSDVGLWGRTSFASVDVAAPARDVRVLVAKTLHDEPGLVWHACPDGRGWCADGTSFAAPQVAGVAALLRDQHDELDTLAPAARARRLRHWIMATAQRVPGRAGGVDLMTGHGRVDAVRAANASVDAARTLLSWEAGSRVLAPTGAMASPPAHLGMKILATTGPGTPLQGRDVVFTPGEGGSVSTERTVTNDAGLAATTVRSSAGGGVRRWTASVAGQALAVDAYVLHRDDNVPGVRAPALSFAGSLNRAVDVDDVYRFNLKASETLRARVENVRAGREQVLLYLHRFSTRDVTNPYRAPIEEDPGFADPRRLSKTVNSDGVRYLDVFGFGTYRLHWRILSPGAVSGLKASVRTITPDGDGDRDSTRLAWRAREGVVTLRIRNAAGAAVRTVSMGVRAAGRQAFRWGGAADNGSRVRPGDYRASVSWTDGRGRTWTTSTKITVQR